MASYHFLTELHYLPSIAYFVRLYPATTLELEVCGSYQKQTYQNRCYIFTSQQVNKLIVPIQHSSLAGEYNQVKIAYNTPWMHRHWRTLCTAYGKAPYFEVLSDILHPILFSKHVFLIDLNVALLHACLQFLGLPKKLIFTTAYNKVATREIFDDRGVLHPKKELPIKGFSTPIYRHVFDRTFVPNLSILDLLFCEGPYVSHKLIQQASEKFVNQRPAYNTVSTIGNNHI